MRRLSTRRRRSATASSRRAQSRIARSIGSRRSLEKVSMPARWILVARTFRGRPMLLRRSRGYVRNPSWWRAVDGASYGSAAHRSRPYARPQPTGRPLIQTYVTAGLPWHCESDLIIGSHYSTVITLGEWFTRFRTGSQVRFITGRIGCNG
jgi:hypothetical protein